ncbi:MAG TPA: PP2C family protein-serine/threonine phosphatase [Acidimicrobiales bacterium]|nr:PP2C family protein-serine/threonine phosphatase [Acidimicrobiales bacterium]
MAGVLSTPTPATPTGMVHAAVSGVVIVHRPILLAVACACGAAAYVWARSSRRLQRARMRLEREVLENGTGQEPLELARSAFSKEVHTTVLYGLLALSALGTSFTDRDLLDLPFLLVLVPVAISLRYAPRFLAAARLAEERSLIERRAEEVLAQEELAPVRWSARLAPQELPVIEGFEVGQVYEPGTGAMAGDFYDLYPTSPTRLAAVIGDVAGRGIEPSITAFQVKYLLRVFLRQYRDPAQAVEELNAVLSSQGRPDELVSLCAVVFDQAASTLRVASAGHPPAWHWHDGEVRPLRATGPLLTLDPRGSYTSREVGLDAGDVLLLYTDGLAEARSGAQLFGEDRIASVLRRDPGQDVDTLCKSLLEAARDFASSPLSDDVAILAIRRT